MTKKVPPFSLIAYISSQEEFLNTQKSLFDVKNIHVMIYDEEDQKIIINFYKYNRNMCLPISIKIRGGTHDITANLSICNRTKFGINMLNSSRTEWGDKRYKFLIQPQYYSFRNKNNEWKTGYHLQIEEMDIATF